MAIHVRSTRRAAKIWRELRIKLARFAVVASILFMLFGSGTMYLIRIFNPPQPSASFIAWQEPAGGQVQSVQQEARAAGAVHPVQITVNPVIISTAEAISLPEVIDVDLADSDVTADSFSVDLGSGFGESRGDGFGDSGSGQGGRGSGRGSGKGSGGAMGYNDDVQVVLVLDASGSMDRLFAAVANSLEELLHTLRECRVNGQQANINVGIVVYGHSRDDGAPFELSPFSQEPEEMRAKVKSINCDGVYENCGEAIDFALKNYPWNKRKRRELLKVVFIAGNESFDQGSVNYRDALARAHGMGIIVNTIHCGEFNPEWRAAARLGGGEGLVFSMQEEASYESPRASHAELIEALYHMPLFPLGSPAEQAALREAHAARPPLPDMSDPKAVYAWSRQHLDSLLRGSRRDAVELCRQLGNSCTPDALGGRGNLPPELRAIEDDTKLIDTLSKLARERGNLISQLRRGDHSSFIGKVLDTLILQAAERGIEITR